VIGRGGRCAEEVRPGIPIVGRRPPFAGGALDSLPGRARAWFGNVDLGRCAVSGSILNRTIGHLPGTLGAQVGTPQSQPVGWSAEPSALHRRANHRLSADVLGNDAPISRDLQTFWTMQGPASSSVLANRPNVPAAIVGRERSRQAVPSAHALPACSAPESLRTALSDVCSAPPDLAAIDWASSGMAFGMNIPRPSVRPSLYDVPPDDIIVLGQRRRRVLQRPSGSGWTLARHCLVQVCRASGLQSRTGPVCCGWQPALHHSAEADQPMKPSSIAAGSLPNAPEPRIFLWTRHVTSGMGKPAGDAAGCRLRGPA